MTSSLDTDHIYPRRNIVFVGGVSTSLSPSGLRLLFQECGSITAIKMRKGYAFITFDEEEAALKSISKTGTFLFDSTITVEFANIQYIPTRREISFPRPFLSRGGSGGGRGSRVFGVVEVASSASRRLGARINRSDNRRNIHCQSVQVIYEPAFFRDKILPNDNSDGVDDDFVHNDILSEAFRNFPHIASHILQYLDLVTIYRCKFVCKEWKSGIQRCLASKTFKDRLRWDTVSLYPVYPTRDESEYRNVLKIKADHAEIILALDNGNVEIYDRYSLERTCILAWEYFSSPDTLDMNSKIILVGYTVGFWGLALSRNPTKSLGWTIFGRKTKQVLYSLEPRDIDHVFIGHNGYIYMATKNTVYAVNNLNKSTKIICVAAGTHVIEAIDVSSDFIIAAVVVEGKKLLVHVWRKPDKFFEEDDETEYDEVANDEINFMTRLERIVPVFPNEFVDERKCRIMSMQVQWPYVLCFLSNNFGTFEFYENRGRPYVLLVLLNLAKEETARVITLDEPWMRHHKIVPFDYDSCVRSARFNAEHLVVGFGSFSDRNDGGIGVWDMEEILNPKIEELTVKSLPAPSYHWSGIDGHTGGVNSLYLDDLGLIAGNSCVHQVSTRCIQTLDETKKDNVIVYDFWSLQPRDLRRSYHINEFIYKGGI